MYQCMYMYMCMWMYICVRVCVYTYLCGYMYKYMYMYEYMYMCSYINTHVCTCLCTHLYVDVFIYIICVYMSMYVYELIWTIHCCAHVSPTSLTLMAIRFFIMITIFTIVIPIQSITMSNPQMIITWLCVFFPCIQENCNAPPDNSPSHL